MDTRAIGFRFPVETRDFSVLPSLALGVTEPPIEWLTESFIPVGVVAGTSSWTLIYIKYKM